MTVSELKKILENYDDNMKVAIAVCYYDAEMTDDVTEKDVTVEEYDNDYDENTEKVLFIGREW